MGRNNVPKMGEWRDGMRYGFRWMGSNPHGGAHRCADGRMIVYELEIRPVIPGGEVVTEVLATAYADGLEEVMAAMFECGYQRGKREGRKAAREEVRRVLLGE